MMLLIVFFINAVFHWLELVPDHYTIIIALCISGGMVINSLLNRDKIQDILNTTMKKFDVSTVIERKRVLKNGFNMVLFVEAIMLFIMWTMMGNSTLIIMALILSVAKLVLAERAMDRNIKLHGDS